MTAEITTLLGRDSSFEGKLSFEGAVRVDGKFRGEIRSRGTLVVGNGSDVNADVEVANCVVEGNFTGNLKATESVEIHAPARVKGSVTTPVLQVEKGVLLDGKCVMGEVEPTAEPVLETTSGPKGPRPPAMDPAISSSSAKPSGDTANKE